MKQQNWNFPIFLAPNDQPTELSELPPVIFITYFFVPVFIRVTSTTSVSACSTRVCLYTETYFNCIPFLNAFTMNSGADSVRQLMCRFRSECTGGSIDGRSSAVWFLYRAPDFYEIPNSNVFHSNHAPDICRTHKLSGAYLAAASSLLEATLVGSFKFFEGQATTPLLFIYVRVPFQKFSIARFWLKWGKNTTYIFWWMV